MDKWAFVSKCKHEGRENLIQVGENSDTVTIYCRKCDKVFECELVDPEVDFNW